jgi:hypothetical protein
MGRGTSAYSKNNLDSLFLDSARSLVNSGADVTVIMCSIRSEIAESV